MTADPTYRILVARAPGRVNLIGDHTDYNQGLALPMALNLATEVHFTENDSGRLLLYTSAEPEPAHVPLDAGLDPRVLEELHPRWARMAAAVAALARPPHGGVGRITSTVPMGAGLSSSAALCVALALAFGLEGTPAVTARLCQRAEAAAGADVGLMDPLVIAAARPGHALLIDFATLETRAVPLPADARVVVVHSGVTRELERSPYAARRAECDAAAVALGAPLGRAEAEDLPGLVDQVLRRRARHVVTECARVRAMAGALGDGDLAAAGAIMGESHRSLAGDFDASVPPVDRLVEDLAARPGVYGARMTGGGFGGCVVALTDPGALDPGEWPGRAWDVRPSGGASLQVLPGG